MSLTEKINSDLITALKAGDSFTTEVLRGVNAAFKNKSIEKRGKGLTEELNVEEVIGILNKEVKKRQDAADLFIKGNRPELAEKEKKEIAVIQKYLPAPLSRAEVEKAVAEVLQKTGVKEFGPAMREALKELKGKADGQLISEIVKSKLSQS